MPLIPLIQRAIAISKSSHRPKITAAISTVCDDPEHEFTKPVPLSQVGMYMRLIKTEGFDAAVETLRRHHESGDHYDYAHDCHQPHCEQPYHQFSQPRHRNNANSCKRYAEGEYRTFQSLSRARCVNRTCLEDGGPCRLLNALLSEVSISVQNFAQLHQIDDITDITAAQTHLIGDKLWRGSDKFEMDLNSRWALASRDKSPKPPKTKATYMGKFSNEL